MTNLQRLAQQLDDVRAKIDQLEDSIDLSNQLRTEIAIELTNISQELEKLADKGKEEEAQ